jgi:fructose-1,6-bisphosphatase I
MPSTRRLDQHLALWTQQDCEREVISLLIGEIANAGIQLAQTIARYDLIEGSESDVVQADVVQGAVKGLAVSRPHPLVQLAQDIFETAVRALPVSVLASSECDELLHIDPQGRYSVVIDPIDGSSNIETNLSIGSLFSILESGGEDLYATAPGARIKAAGFIFYGPQTRLLLSCGEGSFQFLLDPASEQFYQVGGALQIPAGKREFAINTSNYRFWDSNVRHFIDDCIAGEDGALGENFNMRWNASLVAEAYRILVRGGVFLYPGDSRPEYRDGRLRLLFEALPLAMLIEQAGGSASDGSQRILEVNLQHLQARVPLIFGCHKRVLEVIDYISGDTLDSGRFPLFTNRSLLRN